MTCRLSGRQDDITRRGRQFLRRAGRTTAACDARCRRTQVLPPIVPIVRIGFVDGSRPLPHWPRHIQHSIGAGSPGVLSYRHCLAPPAAKEGQLWSPLVMNHLLETHKIYCLLAGKYATVSTRVGFFRESKQRRRGYAGSKSSYLGDYGVPMGGRRAGARTMRPAPRTG